MPRPELRRTVVLLPNGFTLLNLFFGVYAIVSAARGEFYRAGVYVVLGGVADALDGRIARATRTGSRFGSELDSLVDAISFGLAPSMIMYFAVLNQQGNDWIFCYIFTMCAVWRLARFNVEQAGRAKTHFHGLPSPAAGLTLATYYWFSQTPLYSETAIGNLPWHQMLRFIMIGLSFLMVSNVSYAAVPTIGFRSWREIMGTLLIVGTIVGVIFFPPEFFFPALLGYVVYGLLRTVFLGLIDRLPGALEDELTGEDVVGPSDGATPEEAGHRRRRRRRRHRIRPGAGAPPPTTMEEPRA